MITKTQLTKEELKRFGKHFNVSFIPSNQLFERIFNYKIDECDTQDFTTSDFFNVLYVVNDSIRNCYKDLIRNIRNHKQFHILHSYGQNGKSTFLRYFLFEADNDRLSGVLLKQCFFDFSDRYRDSRDKIDVSYFNRCCRFFQLSFLQFKSDDIEKFGKELGSFVRFIQQIREATAQDNNYVNIHDFFGGYVDEFQLLVESVFFQNKHEDTPIGQKNRFNKGVEKLLKNHEGKVSGSDLFCFIIFFKIFQNRAFFASNKEAPLDDVFKKRKKLVIVIDNIDDIQSHMAETIATNQTDYLTDYFHRFNSFLQPFISEFIPGLYLQSDIIFIFSYRTANYLNSVHAYKRHLNQSMIERYAHAFINADVYKISTVKSSFEIVSSRLFLYASLCEYYNRRKSENYHLLKALLATVSPYRCSNMDDFVMKDDKNELSDIRHIFRLWNGNRKALYNIVKYDHAANLFKEANKIPDKYSYLRKGAFIYLSLHVLHNKRNYYQLGRLIDHLFTYHKECFLHKKPSLFRLILTYMIELNDSRENRKIKKTEDIFSNGVSFGSVLRSITLFKDRFNHSVYSQNEFTKLFELLFFEEIDEWSHLLSCYKGTSFVDGNGMEHAGKKFQFRNDIALFFKYFDFDRKEFTDKEVEKRLKSIKFYYNDNCKYLITHVIMHFEFYLLSLGGEKPLFLLNENIITDKRELDFEFTNAITKVFSQVEKSINANVDFYLNVISKYYTHNKFSLESRLCINNKFFFADLISKHITYIEQFRRCILDKDIRLPSIKSQSEETQKRILTMANEKLTNAIYKYLKLFFQNYVKIEKVNKNIPTTLKGTFTGFKYLQERADLIMDSDYTDFGTLIKTDPHTLIREKQFLN